MAIASDFLVNLMDRAAELGLAAFHNHHAEGALSVGCVITTATGEILSEGFSRELSPADYASGDFEKSWHAEAVALHKFRQRSGAPIPEGALLFSTIEPCGVRASGGHACVPRIVAAGIRHIAYGLAEPLQLVQQVGLAQLERQFVDLQQIVTDPIYTKIIRANPHIRWPDYQQLKI